MVLSANRPTLHAGSNYILAILLSSLSPKCSDSNYSSRSQHEKTKIIIDLPAPPPPSPEPSDKPRLSTQHEEESTQHDSSTTASHPQLATAAVIDMSDLSDLPLNNQSDEAPQTVNQSEVDIADNSLSAVPKLNTELTQISQLTEQTEQSVDDAAVGEKEEIRDQMELNVEVKTGQDALSRVPDYQDMDMDRHVYLLTTSFSWQFFQSIVYTLRSTHLSICPLSIKVGTICVQLISLYHLTLSFLHS